MRAAPPRVRSDSQHAKGSDSASRDARDRCEAPVRLRTAKAQSHLASSCIFLRARLPRFRLLGACPEAALGDEHCAACVSGAAISRWRHDASHSRAKVGADGRFSLLLCRRLPSPAPRSGIGAIRSGMAATFAPAGAEAAEAGCAWVSGLADALVAVVRGIKLGRKEAPAGLPAEKKKEVSRNHVLVSAADTPRNLLGELGTIAAARNASAACLDPKLCGRFRADQAVAIPWAPLPALASSSVRAAAEHTFKNKSWSLCLK